MRTFGPFRFALATLSSFITLTSASLADIPSPPHPPAPTDFLDSTAALPTPVIPFIFNPGYTTLAKRQTPYTHLFGHCDRVEVGKHNCPLMKKACFMFFEANWEPGAKERDNYQDLCKRYICVQTMGDCSPLSCSWC